MQHVLWGRSRVMTPEKESKSEIFLEKLLTGNTASNILANNAIAAVIDGFFMRVLFLRCKRRTNADFLN